ncbi:MAG: hypothetical protein OXH53_11025 [bacterium]|nr:hypothetical protein [bacterium]
MTDWIDRLTDQHWHPGGPDRDTIIRKQILAELDRDGWTAPDRQEN